ncbi:MAG TPA: histidine phosphatase family protein [Streptosporangiaceae bacterium]
MGGAEPPAGPGPRLVRWRHGQTVWNFENRFQGQTDIPLDDLGVAQADRAARLLAALRPDAIFASDLSRATSTAAPLARLTGLPVTLDKDLRERHGGEWEGLTGPEIRSRYPAEFQTWSPPGGELADAVADRVYNALERIIETLPAGALAVVASHGAAIRLGMCKLLGLPEDVWDTIGPLSNCSWSVLGTRRGHWRLMEHNAGTLPEPVLSDDR